MNYYEILGIPYNATQDEIKKSFRELAMKYHPHMNQDIGANEIMQGINIAYETLSDLEKRKKYDKGFNKENKVAYDSYTENRQENESDLDEWLKEYLKRKRYLNQLYESYKKIEGNNIRALRSRMKPSPHDVYRAKTLLDEIKKTLYSFVNELDENPIAIFELLFSELILPTNAIYLSLNNHIQADPEHEIMKILIENEIKLNVKKYINPRNKNYHEIIVYVLKKYAKLADINNQIRMHHYKPAPSQELTERMLLEILKTNKSYVKSILVDMSTRTL